MADEFFLEDGETLWHLWNRKNGAHTDSGDAGFIMLKPEGYEAFSRGDTPASQGVFATREAVAAALRAIY